MVAVGGLVSRSAWAGPDPRAVVGRWKTVDDNSGKIRSVVQLQERGGTLVGHIRALMEDPEATCDKCEGSRKNQPIVGMQVIWGLRLDDDEWSGGRALDPENGKAYRCKIWLETRDELRIRGYIGPFFRTQTWFRN